MRFSAVSARLLLVLAVVGFLPSVSAVNAEDRLPYLAGYDNHSALAQRVEALKASDLVSVHSLGESVGGRKLWAIAVGRGERDQKPAIAVVGSADGKHLLGSELTIRMAEQLVKQAADQEETGKLLDRYTVYFIPRPDPDTAEKCFAKLAQTPEGNDRPTDDDRDFEVGEDPADDLNDDGLITLMRVEDDTGTYIPHPNDDRLMIKADPKKQERGRFRLLTEGRDDDGDEQFNEDGSGGVAIDHNFPQQYRPFRPHTGEHSASEPETRALIDFFYDHPNIAIVFAFSPDDNLYHPWKPNDEKPRIRKAIFAGDASLLEPIAADYKKVHGGSDAPGPGEMHGSFTQWSYFHYGRWTLSARGWWPPKVEAKSEDKSDNAEAKENSEKKPPEEDKRAADERNLLRWLQSQDIDGFVPWKAVEHPDFPGKPVEVGGFKPLVGLNPPAGELDGLAEKHLKFVLTLPTYLPELAIVDAEATSLGGGVYRVEASLVNRGYLPTASEMGQTNGQPHPLQFGIELPEGAELLKGHRRERVGRLESGGKAEKSWLVRFAEGAKPEKLTVKAWAPAVGEVATEVPLR